VTPYSVRSASRPEAIQAVQRVALAAVEPGAAVWRHVRRRGDELRVGGRTYDLARFERVWVVGGGKAAVPMAAALQAILTAGTGRPGLAGGLVVTKYGHVDPGLDTGPIEVVEAGHPVPDAAGMEGARRLADLLTQAGGRDLVLAAISGGASALLPLPVSGLGLDDVQETTQLLLRAGATIVELNTVRKHLSQLKGGGMARLAGQAQVAGLILSDVVGDPLDVIASGPLAPDPTTFGDALQVLARYDLLARVPVAVLRRLEAGQQGELPETPKPGMALFDRVQTIIVGSNRLAAEAAVEAARGWRLNALLLSTYVEGEAREVARVAAALAKEVAHHSRPVARPACLVWGGETTVTVHGEGRGGRNQELALAAALAMEGLEDVVLVALGTDGTDGPTDAAGAVATGRTLARARERGLDARAYLRNNDAYAFFDALDDLIRTGPTGTNVNDLLFLYVF
jgi:hydroxypyruvate reductase